MEDLSMNTIIRMQSIEKWWGLCIIQEGEKAETVALTGRDLMILRFDYLTLAFAVYFDAVTLSSGSSLESMMDPCRRGFSKAAQSVKDITHAASVAPVDEGSCAIFKNPVWTRKSQTLLVLLTSILTRSRASRRRSFPPLRAYSRTSVSLITRYGFGKMRSMEQRVCSPGVRRWSEGLFARLRGAAEQTWMINVRRHQGEKTYEVYE